MFFDNGMQFTFTLLVICLIVSWIVPLVAPFVIIGGFVYYLNIEAVSRSNREAKRMANMAMAPILSTTSECVSGLVPIAPRVEHPCVAAPVPPQRQQAPDLGYHNGSELGHSYFLGSSR